MEPICAKEFARKHVKGNKGESYEDLLKRLRVAIKKKESKTMCINCKSNLIWAIGSAITGTDFCFTCLTGESDDSEDYEVY